MHISRQVLRKNFRYTMEVDTILKYWLLNNLENPFANAENRKLLANKTNLSEMQVSNWFRNARRTKWFKKIIDIHRISNDSTDIYQHQKKKILNLE